MKKSLLLILLTCLSNLTFSQNSVLSQGTWYKFGVKGEGVYCIAASDLSSVLSIPISNAQHIQIYGNKSGMLPLRFDAPHTDDLVEIPILVKGEVNGLFEMGDTIFFYAPSADKRIADMNSKSFSIQKNVYSDSVYFFLTVGSSPGKRMNAVQSLASSTNSTTSYNEFYWHETDSINLIKSGKSWYGEHFNLNGFASRSFNFDVSHIVPGESVSIIVNYAGRTFLSGSASFEISSNSFSHSKQIASVGTSPQDPYARAMGDTIIVGPSISSGLVTCALTSSDSNTTVYLNSLSLNFRSNLDIYLPQQLFSDMNSVGPGNITSYTLNTSNPSQQIWDITDPLNPAAQLFTSTPTTVSFNVANDSVHAYIAFDGHTFLNIGPLRTISNQNLHSVSQADYLIITNPEFYPDANTLATFRQSHDGMSVKVATTEEIYNEYSAGAQDPVAIRNYISSVYDFSAASGDSLKYVLLFGNGSYDHRGRLGFHSSYVPSYQSKESLIPIVSITFDEFYAYMNDTATDYYVNKPAFGIGRIPARNLTEAAVVNRIIDYSTSSQTMGDWRKKFVTVADDQDYNTHFKQMDTICNRLENYYCDFDISKIYIDAYPQLATPQGNRYPDVNSEISAWLNRGCLALQFIGHGGELGWAHERILDTLMLQSVPTNILSPLIISTTSEVNHFDNPVQVSCGQMISTNATGAGIASVSDSRVAFSSSQYNFYQRFDSLLFAKSNNQHLRLGDILRGTRLRYTDPYTQSYCLLGDPALMLNYPKNEIVITAINGNLSSSIPDTLIPGQPVQIDGEVRDLSGNLMSSFNGQVNLLLFDQKTLHVTLANDSVGFDLSQRAQFYVWDDTVNYITTSVTNGVFSASFHVAWDLDSAIGNGKLSTYAFDSNTDASGCYENFVYRNLTFGLDEFADVNINVYPNPSTDIVVFELSDLAHDLQLTFIDVNGRIVKSEKVHGNKFQVRKNELSRGAYFYRLSDSGGKLIKRGKIVFE